MKFDSGQISGLLINKGDVVGKSLRDVDPSSKVVVAQGFGVGDTHVPVRFLSYLVPVLYLLYQLPSSAKAEFYFALEGVLRANGQDEKITRNNVLVMQDIIRKYVVTFHPKLFSRIKILTDCRIEVGSPLAAILDSLMVKAWSICEADPVIANFVKQRGGDVALRYMLEHLLYMRDPVSVSSHDLVLVPEMTRNMDYLVMVGGPAEKIFYRFRQAMCATIDRHKRWKSFQFFTPIGNPPTYYHQSGEPSWQNRSELGLDAIEVLKHTAKEVTSDNSINKNVIRDLIVLMLDSGGNRSFAEAGQLRGDIIKSRDIPDWVEEALRQGWNRILAL